jgi:histidyl-tRNA synthetase
MAKRQFIFNTLQKQFRLFGFQQIETPAMENLSVLTGKYGEEGDRLIFKILNSGDYLSGVADWQMANGASKLTPLISEKALRYDLTVPFARYVANNRGVLTFPFRRFQMQPVWRADRPQRGRYREFWQCDADIVGTNSLVAEAELLLLVQSTFFALGFHNFKIKINSRKILMALAEYIGAETQFVNFCTAIDKLDKIGVDGVRKELTERGIAENSVDKLAPFLAMKGDGFDLLEQWKGMLAATPSGPAGMAELQAIASNAQMQGLPEGFLDFDPTLARGLDYYTGCIIEVKPQGIAMGSIAGGGRYDNLAGVFGASGISGVGVSFGVDRIYDVLEELNLFPAVSPSSAKVLIAPLDAEAMAVACSLLASLRSASIAAEIYPEPAKLKKQLAYADKLQIPFVAIFGADELARSKFAVKEMNTGAQEDFDVEGFIVKMQVLSQNT